MDVETHEKWLAATRRFWDVDNAFDAKYRRICSSPEFDRTTEEGELSRLWERETDRMMPVILRSVPIRPEWVCLEIGCGIGRLMRPIARRCRKVIGVDLSEPMVRWAREYLSDVENVELIVNDGRTLEAVESASVDFVFSHLAFQHMTLPEVVDSYLSEIARVLKPGGYCRIQTSREAPRPMAEAVKDIIRPVLGRERYRSPRYWRWAMTRAVQFGGLTYRPAEWRKLLAARKLRPVSVEVGVGHDHWMWSTSIRD